MPLAHAPCATLDVMLQQSEEKKIVLPQCSAELTDRPVRVVLAHNPFGLLMLRDVTAVLAHSKFGSQTVVVALAPATVRI